MKNAAFACLILMSSSCAALAQDGGEERGSLMQEGARMFLRGILEEMEPALDGLQSLAEDMRPALSDFVEEMGPALRDLLTEVEDWSVYHPPEMLPNGDIILRRKQPVAPQDEIEL